MKSNESIVDRLIRLALGTALALIVAFKVVSGGLAIVLGIVAAVALITGAVGFCGIYALLGASTCKISPKS